ncbi:hypothetical protein JAAARDRAFT_659313 [Jaapia argillacea MUCL 33604]|uniref:Uncharacterized protein n=1 Tax=Jaapia argillacea MUCL 33604 TaxID=933084 RepID=A0A067Q9Q5_9AGAM|nr:hypothetical protein JAAARDRAFT_659313 [Jaapia argillacea MUCL 33604]
MSFYPSCMYLRELDGLAISCPNRLSNSGVPAVNGLRTARGVCRRSFKFSSTAIFDELHSFSTYSQRVCLAFEFVLRGPAHSGLNSQSRKGRPRCTGNRLATRSPKSSLSCPPPPDKNQQENHYEEFICETLQVGLPASPDGLATRNPNAPGLTIWPCFLARQLPPSRKLREGEPTR